MPRTTSARCIVTSSRRNILLSDYGEPQLTDFGIARIGGGFQTSTGVITGSPAFTAPEVLEGAMPTPASDVYSLGATIVLRADRPRRLRTPLAASRWWPSSCGSPPNRYRTCVNTDCQHDVAAADRTGNGPRSDGPSGQRGGSSAKELRDVQRRNSVAVDKMARPVDLGVEQRQPPVPPSTVRRHTIATPTPPTPGTKYRAPVATQSLVARGRLTDILRAAGRRRLILIDAPSGFGKSTLAAQWREALSHEGVAVAWLTVDEDDNNAVWFLAHLLEAIRRVHPTLAASLGQVLDEHGDDAARYVLTTLIDAIHENDDRIALVVDDWHRVSDPATTAALGFLLEHGCHHLQIIVTSWSRAGLPVGKIADPRRVGRNQVPNHCVSTSTRRDHSSTMWVACSCRTATSRR